MALHIWRCCLEKDKAKSVPTFKCTPKGVMMRTLVQKGCTTMDILHQNSAFMENVSTALVQFVCLGPFYSS
ncbi:hypothetical protein [Serratia marcescens]|uniref:hypothetical protein n=1 Tax=Serratia marcescens TaxID=615 RepID=UPI000E2C2ED7|nr:hypothetical protein [Serratia marcescens]